MTQPLTLWLTDRSRYTTGLGRCGWERYLKYHFGPTGYGIGRRSESLPLMTGQYTHLAIEILFDYLLQRDELPPVGYVREAVTYACAEYEKRIAGRGFRGILASESTELVITEQQTLLTGLIWAFAQTVLPWIHTEFRVVQAELESIYVLDCTCGLGSAVLDARQHDERGCHGVGQMIKQDCLAERRRGQGVAYFESKTTGWAGENWAPQWETKPQLSIGSFGILERLGKEVTELYVIGLYKGYRKKSEDAFGQVTVRQESPFCYGYCRPGNPPIATDDWLPTYSWTDEEGREHRASRQHKKRGVWELAESDWPEAVQARTEGLSPAELWVMTLPESVRKNQVFLVGPLNRQDQQIADLKQAIVGEERQWQEVLWKLYELEQHGHGWSTPEFQKLLNELVPRSWECRRFGAKHECEMVPICFHQAGWDDPLGSGTYVARRPHHEPELEQAVARGLLPEQSEEEEVDEE